MELLKLYGFNNVKVNCLQAAGMSPHPERGKNAVLNLFWILYSLVQSSAEKGNNNKKRTRRPAIRNTQEMPSMKFGQSFTF